MGLLVKVKCRCLKAGRMRRLSTIESPPARKRTG